MIFQSNWTTFESKKSPLQFMYSLFGSCLVHICWPSFFSSFQLKWKVKSAMKDWLHAFCFSHTNLLLYFFTHRSWGISSCQRHLRSPGPSAISPGSAEAEKESRAVAEQQLNIQISLFKQPETLQNHAWDKMTLKFQSLNLCLVVLQKWAVHSRPGFLIDTLPSEALE